MDGTCSGTHVDQPFAAVESYDFSQSDWTTIGTIPFARAINYYTGTGSTNWPTMYWATGAVWIGSQSYNMMDLNGNYYDDYLGNNQAPSWVYVAGCLQGQPSACTTGSTGSYNKFSAGYSSSLGAYSPSSSTSLLWALPPAASWSFIYAPLSQSLTFSYVVTNPNGFDMYLGLGAYVRQTSNPGTIYIDPTHDTVVRASQCVSSCSRTFGLYGLSPGSYDVGAALWSGQPNQSPFVALWGINWQNDAFTISYPTVSVAVYSIDLQFKGQDPALQSDLHGSISNSYQGSASTTAYSFQVPVNTQVTFSVSSSPSGWGFAGWWDDYGYGQSNTSSFTVNVGTSNHEIAAFFLQYVTVTITKTSTVSATTYSYATTTTTTTSYTSTSTSTSTIPTLTTVVLVPLTVTSTVQSTQLLTSTLTTTATSYTSTETSTSTIPTLTTVVLVPSTVTSTVQSTQFLTSTSTTTVTSYTATTTSTSTIVVYTTTTKLAAAVAGESSPLVYLGFLSLLALTVGHTVTADKGWRIPRSRTGRRCSKS